MKSLSELEAIRCGRISKNDIAIRWTKGINAEKRTASAMEPNRHAIEENRANSLSCVVSATTKLPMMKKTNITARPTRRSAKIDAGRMARLELLFAHARSPPFATSPEMLPGRINPKKRPIHVYASASDHDTAFLASIHHLIAKIHGRIRARTSANPRYANFA